MIFDVYFAFRNKEGKVCPGIKPNPMEWARIKKEVLQDEKTKKLVESYRETHDQDMKKWLPSICFVGSCKNTRRRDSMVPTQLVMIDIDHCEDPKGAWQSICDTMTMDWIAHNVILAHITPSGKGIHIIFIGQGYETLKENMDWFNEKADFSQYGDYDSVVHDFARISFAFPEEDILFESMRLLMAIPPELEAHMKNPFLVEEGAGDSDDGTDNGSETKPKGKSISSDIPRYSDEEKEKFENSQWRNIPLKTIIAAWIEYRGEPGENEIHNYYNEMVKYFRNIMGNNRRLIFYLLPKFGHSDEECWSQVVSITRSNTLSEIDKPFYFFLKNKGFYVSTRTSSIDQYMLADTPVEEDDGMPTLPPVFREFVKSAPKDFRVPAINALLPILGTLTSYLQAKYPYDDEMHTTSFFSIIYAPPGTGKGFVGRFMFLFDDIKLRDQIMSAREEIYLNALNRKGANDKGPEKLPIQLRLIPPKNSEAEFLEKQRYNQGYHMFTYAAEMDSWAKGEKAAGGNKSDMIRIAWDNGEYGQQFKSAATFKGKVRLYWNVLITGTQAQVERYFNNVENGLVTRCSFTSIENQEFQLASMWKPITKKGMSVIKNFMKRCDENSYEEPCTLVIDDVLSVNEDKFDDEIDWKFKFKPKQTVDMNWIMPVIDAFHKRQCEQASLDIDRARDVFRRRVGVRGFRLALLCTALYPKLTTKNMETIKNFVNWWMEIDLECMLKLWGAKYNDQAEVEPQLYQRNAYHTLKEVFTKNDLFVVLKQQHIKSPLRQILYQWKKCGYIDKVDKENYKKIKK